MSEYFPEPKSSGGRVKGELGLSNFATNTDLTNAAGVDTSKFAKTFDLASLKCNIDKLDIDRLNNVPINLILIKLGFLRVVFPGEGDGGGGI